MIMNEKVRKWIEMSTNIRNIFKSFVVALPFNLIRLRSKLN